MMPRPLKLAVIGDPVAHSASPALHRAFLIEAGLSGTYEAIRIVAGEGARGIDALRDRGYTGLNVTTPLKEEAFRRADSRDSAALASGAVNTLVMTRLGIAGYNTDGIGALGALREAGLTEFEGARVLVLGAGPTARATVATLVSTGAEVAIWNRTREKAEVVARELGATVWESSKRRIDAVFATLSPGAEIVDEALRDALGSARIVVDANYADRSTLGATLGREVATGLTMLGASARASFGLFRGERDAVG